MYAIKDIAAPALVLPVLIHVEMELSCRMKQPDVMMVILLMEMDVQVHARWRLALTALLIMSLFQTQYVRV